VARKCKSLNDNPHNTQNSNDSIALITLIKPINLIMRRDRQITNYACRKVTCACCRLLEAGAEEEASEEEKADEEDVLNESN